MSTKKPHPSAHEDLLPATAHGSLYIPPEPSAVGKLLVQWIWDKEFLDGNNIKQFAKYLGAKLASYKHQGRIALTSGPIDRHESIGRFKGHLCSEQALATLAGLFRNPEEKLEALKAAVAQDRKTMRQHHVNTALKTQDIKEFIDHVSANSGRNGLTELATQYHDEKQLSNLVPLHCFSSIAVRSYLKITPDFQSWLVDTLELANHPELLQKFQTLLATVEIPRKKSARNLDERVARQSISDFLIMLKYASDKALAQGSQLEDYHPLAGHAKNMGFDPATMTTSTHAVTAMVQSKMFPTQQQFDTLCGLLEKVSQSAQKPNSPWFDEKWFGPRGKNHSQTGRVFSVGFKEQYQTAAAAFKKLAAAVDRSIT